MDEQLRQMVQTCADRNAIENLLGLYCRGIDRLDLELLKSVYHPDSIDDHGIISANGHEFAEQIVALLGQVCVYSQHSVTHAVIEVKGDVAFSEAQYVGFHTIGAGAESIEAFFGPTYLEEQRQAGKLDKRHEYLCGGRYLDVLHKRDGLWRIYRRKMTNEWAVCRPETAVREGIAGAVCVPGSRDRNDPVYRLMQG
jgi:hypothetical protein